MLMALPARAAPVGAVSALTPERMKHTSYFALLVLNSARVVQELGQVDGVCSFWEAAQSLVASLAERMGLLAHTPDAVEAAREKQVWGLILQCWHVHRLVASAWLCTCQI